MRHRRSRHAAALSLALSAAAFAVPAGGAPVPTPPWLSPNGTHFAVTTTGGWELGGATAGGSHAKARLVHALDRVYPKSNDAIDRQGRAAVWAPTCLPGAQTIRLRKTIEVPGPPGKVSAAINPWTTGGLRIVSASLYVNGQLLATTGPGGYGGFSPTASKAALFRFGQNTVELVATKAPSPKGAAPCNSSKAAQLGVFAWVKGEFATDLALEPASDKAFAAVGTPHVTGEIRITARNNGPGGAARGRFWFLFALPYTEDVTFVETPDPAAPFRKCTLVKSPIAPTYEGTCEFADFRARSSYVLRFRYGAGNSKQGKDVHVVARWGIYLEGEDQNGTNNERLAKLWFCERGIADGGKTCQPAS